MIDIIQTGSVSLGTTVAIIFMATQLNLIVTPKELAQFRLKVSEEYVKHDDLADMKRTMIDLRHDVKSIYELLIKGHS